MKTNDATSPEALHLVCAQCGAINRVPSVRLAEQPHCGRCRGLVLDAYPLALNEGSFQRFIEKNDLPVVVDFWAGWCGPCQTMAPVFAQLSAEWGQRIRFAKLDVDAEPAIAKRYGVRSIPTLIRFERGNEIRRQAGAMPGSALRAWLAG